MSNYNNDAAAMLGNKMPPAPISRMESLLGDIKTALADNAGAIDVLNEATKLVRLPIPPGPGSQPENNCPGSFAIGELEAIVRTIQSHTDNIRALVHSLEV